MLIRSNPLFVKKKIIDEAIAKEGETTQTKVISEDILLGDFCLCCSSGIQCSKGLNTNHGDAPDTDSVITTR